MLYTNTIIYPRFALGLSAVLVMGMLAQVAPVVTPAKPAKVHPEQRASKPLSNVLIDNQADRRVRAETAVTRLPDAIMLDDSLQRHRTVLRRLGKKMPGLATKAGLASGRLLAQSQ